jgi:hypothetical protein
MSTAERPSLRMIAAAGQLWTRLANFQEEISYDDSYAYDAASCH